MSDMLLKDCKTGLSKANEEIRKSHLQEEKEKLKPVYDISEKLSNVSCDVSNIN